jgi:glycosyltransferase involved in cell wall biosynthesis
MRLRYNPIRNIVIRHILATNTQIRTCVSEAHRQALEANDLPRFRVVYNGLDPAQFDVSAQVIERLRARLDLANRQIILFGGRLTRDKGTQQILAALNKVRTRVPAVLLLVLTPGTLHGQVFDAPEFRAVREQHVRPGGWLSGDELAAAYHAADLVTLPSIIMETAGMVNLEGMAARKPLISTCYGGSPEIVVDSETGYIVNPYDTATFADRLERLLLDPALRQRMGEAGRQRLEERFTLTMHVNNMLTAYQDAIINL